MNFKIKTLWSITSLAAVLMLAGSAHANTINFSVWCNQPNDTAVPTSTAGLGATCATGTFTATTGQFNLASPPGTYTISGFLTSGGGTASILTGSGSLNLNNTVFEFTGSYSATGGVESISHDDGIYGLVDGVLQFNARGPNADEITNSLTSIGAGNHSFDLIYGETDGAPAVLTASPFETAPTPGIPEPSTLLLFGTGLVGAAGALRRRLVR